MYVLTNVFERSRYTRVISSIRSTVDKNAALAVVEEELETTIVQTLDENERWNVIKYAWTFQFKDYAIAPSQTAHSIHGNSF